MGGDDNTASAIGLSDQISSVSHRFAGYTPLMARLILLEDEPILRSEFAGFLGERGHIVDSVGSVSEFRAVFAPADHLIALIDLGLPDGDGVELIEWLRSQGRSLGIIIISARGSTGERVRGLSIGADHYITKPVELDELAAVTSALARRLDTGGVHLRWILNIRRHELIPPGKSAILLPPQGVLVLEAIAAGAGQPVDRRRIVQALGEDYLLYDQRRLDTQIHQLRKLVSESCGLELPIGTLRNRGYRACVDIEIDP